VLKTDFDRPGGRSPLVPLWTPVDPPLLQRRQSCSSWTAPNEARMER